MSVGQGQQHRVRGEVIDLPPDAPAHIQALAGVGQTHLPALLSVVQKHGAASVQADKDLLQLLVGMTAPPGSRVRLAEIVYPLHSKGDVHAPLHSNQLAGFVSMIFQGQPVQDLLYLFIPEIPVMCCFFVFVGFP